MKSVVSTFAIGICFLSSTLPLPLIAETQTSPIVVTASRTSETTDDSLASVSVITREQIQNSGAREVADLLRMQVGIDISKNGGAGALANVFTRGTNANHTLFMIDGVRAASSATGTFSLERLTLNDIEKIEIVRGPRSTQHGSEAIGGIIHIFTRKDKSHHARIGAGSFGTKQASAGAVFGNKYIVRLNGSYEQADGFSATNPNAGFFYNADKDGYRKNNYNLSFSAPFSDSIQLELSGWGSNNQTEYDQGVTDSVNQNFAANFSQQINSIWSHKILAGYNYENLVTTSASPSDITTSRTQIDWQNDISLGNKLLLLAGFTRYEDNAKNINTGSAIVDYDETISNNAVFYNLSYSGDRHDFLFSERVDDHSTFGSAITGLASWGIRINSEARLTVTISNAFRAPSISELYHPGFDFGLGPWYAGNPNLQPETSDGGEISFRLRTNEYQSLNITYFSNWIKNLIAYEGDDFQAINVGRARTEGLELEHAWQQGKWSLNTNLTLQRATNEDTKQDLLRRPRRKAAMTLAYAHNKHASSRLEALYSSSRFDIDSLGNRIELPAYTIFNLATRFKIDKNVWVDARIDNFTDKQYELVSGFNTPDRSIFLGISYEAE